MRMILFGLMCLIDQRCKHAEYHATLV
jgi:hypothetical protein